MIDKTDVISVFPELETGYSFDLWILALADGNRASICGESETTIRNLRIALAAHLLACSRPSAGAVKSEQVGAIKREFHEPPDADQLSSTRYGRIASAILDTSLAAGPHVV